MPDPDRTDDEPPSDRLRRTLNLPMMVLYGLGTTVGAGIYALLGEIAAVAGYRAPWSFLLASALAAFTALSFAELCGRYPRAAGTALYVQRGFHSTGAALLVGLLVVVAAVVSSGALINGFIGYAQTFVQADRTLMILGTTTALVAVAAWGVAQSVALAGLISVIEVGGLLWMIGLGADEAIKALPAALPELAPTLEGTAWMGILSGTMLAFYAFIGFEDMVDVAEEVTAVRRTLPRAILLTLVITTLIYMALTVTAVLAVTPGRLAESEAPLAALYQQLSGREPTVISAIGLFAIINGALIQIVMAARVLYGLASRGQLPSILARVNPVTQTPIRATLTVGLGVGTLAMIGGLAALAEITSLVMLSIFALVNLALWRIKGREPAPAGAPSYPRVLPLAGFGACTFMVIHASWPAG